MMNRLNAAKFFAIAAVVSTTGCGGSTQILPRPPGGYDAIRFKETIIVPDGTVNEYQFPAGTTLIADRVISPEWQAFCGTALINGGLIPVCVGFEGNAIVLGGWRRVSRPVSPTAVERTKV